MTREEMIIALRAVGAELEERGIAAKLYVVGGALMVLSYDSREATFDVDGDFYPRDVVTEVAEKVARMLDLPSDWLNAAANGFIPVFKSPEWRPLYTFGSLEVLAADDRTMLAMKIRASRGQRDEPDIALLLQRCGVTSTEEAMALYEEYFPEDPAPKRTRTILDYLLNSKE
jgi:hypothetical protein